MTYARVDTNQSEIVDALRKVGCTVQSLATIGHGCPDLLVGYMSRTYLLEVKDGKKAFSDRQLTEMEVDWHKKWKGGLLFTVEDVQGALAAVGVMR